MQDVPNAGVFEMISQVCVKIGVDISFAENLPEQTRHQPENGLEWSFLCRVEFCCRKITNYVFATRSGLDALNQLGLAQASFA